MRTPRGLNEPVRWNSSAFRRASRASDGTERRRAVQPTADRHRGAPHVVGRDSQAGLHAAILRADDNAVVSPAPHPIRLRVTDELERSRLTVLFRLLLALPLLVWVVLWSLAVFVVAFVMWLAVLFERRVPATLHGFVASFVRYATHVFAYLTWARTRTRGSRPATTYPVDLEIDPPATQGRWGARIPAAAGGAGARPRRDADRAEAAAGSAWSRSDSETYARSATREARRDRGVPRVVRLPRAGAHAARAARSRRVRARVRGAGLRLRAPAHRRGTRTRSRACWCRRRSCRSIRCGSTVTDGLHRSRLTVFFRLLLDRAAPRLARAVGGTRRALASIAGWFAALVLGRVPLAAPPLPRRVRALHQSRLRVRHLVGGPFPGFVGGQGSYPVDLEIEPPDRQGRWGVAFRLVLAVPAFLLAGAYGAVLLVVAVLGWFAALVTTQVPVGLRDLGAVSIRYDAQTRRLLLVADGAVPVLGTRPRRSGPGRAAPAGARAAGAPA